MGGFFAGIVIGLATTALAAKCVGEWFVEGRSEQLGTVMGFQALGGASMAFVAGALNSVLPSYKITYLLMIAIMAVMCFGANILFIRDPKKLGQPPLGASEDGEQVDLPGVSYSDALKTPTLWIILVMTIVVAICDTSANTYGPTYWQAHGVDPMVSTTFLTIYFVVSSLSSKLSGTINKRFGETATVIFLCGFLSFGLFTYYLWPILGGSVPVLLACCLITGIGFPAFNSMAPMIATGCFGPKDYSKITPLLQGALYIGGAFASPIIAWLTALNGGEMQNVFAVTATGTAFALVLGVIATKMSPYKKMREK